MKKQGEGGREKEVMKEEGNEDARREEEEKVEKK